MNKFKASAFFLLSESDTSGTGNSLQKMRKCGFQTADLSAMMRKHVFQPADAPETKSKPAERAFVLQVSGIRLEELKRGFGSTFPYAKM